jgi:hyaluronoglucosaminidase
MSCSATTPVPRKPTLWDNQPVNDGPQMSRFLHLRGFTGRPSAIGPHIAALAIHPAMRPQPSLIAAATLVASHHEGSPCAHMRALRETARAVAGDAHVPMLEEDLHALQYLGLDRLGEEHQRYLVVNHPMAAEVVRWLDGADTLEGWVEET